MSKKLLLADDSITIQKVIQITFAHEDYELTITDNGDAALAKAQEIKPDLVMTDVYMPGKNGYELTSAIKQDPSLQHVPVLLLAGSFEPFDEDKARSCKADAWIEKPFESQNLIDKVAELLSAAPATAEAPSPVAEPEPVAVVEPAAVAVEETPLAAFDEPVSAEPEVAAVPEDPFGDISFEEEAPAPAAVPAPEPEPVAVADDWAEVTAEPEITETTELPVDETFAAAEETVADIGEDFSFAEEEPVVADDFEVAEDFVTTEDVPVAEADLDVFEMGDDEIMPLGDDDILGAEDLEPAMPEQTLAAWSRSDTDDEDIFGEPVEESVLQEEPVFEEEAPAFIEEEPVAEVSPVFDEPVLEETSAFEEPAVEPVVEEETAAIASEPAAVEELAPVAVAATMVDVEAKTSAMSEEDIEKIVEKVVTKVVEKFAESILEKVAWEVVPDLAENMIRDEIRKIKDAAA